MPKLVFYLIFTFAFKRIKARKHSTVQIAEPQEQEEQTMKAFITIVGLNSYYGTAPFHEDQKLTLIKEPENRYDTAMIKKPFAQNCPVLAWSDCQQHIYRERRMYERRPSLRQNRRPSQCPRLLHSCQCAGVPRKNAYEILRGIRFFGAMKAILYHGL